MNLQANLDAIPNSPPIEKGVYRHYKGNEYDVIGVAFHSETLEPLVIYRPLEIKKGPEFWVRPYDMFFDTVAIDGATVPRFQKIN